MQEWIPVIPETNISELIHVINLNTVVGHMLKVGRKVVGSIPYKVIWLSIDIILPVTLSPEVDSACNRNEYQEA
jgi:hypothetical protein